MKTRILVRGSNDVGSAVTHALFSAGYTIAIHEFPEPTVTRRKMAFTDAVFDGRTSLNGLEARLIKQSFLLRGILIQRKIVLITICKFEKVIKIIRPHVLVDARMRKHQHPEQQLGLAPLTIGLGPNFIAGNTTHLAIETGWGEHLGQVVRSGAPLPLQGEPKTIDGHARNRYVYAPCAGIFQTAFQPGGPVEQGQEIARIDNTMIRAPLTGVLRGITRSGVPVSVKTKVIEVDPRGEDAQFSGIGERPAIIAQGVLLAIQEWKQHHAN